MEIGAVKNPIDFGSSYVAQAAPLTQAIVNVPTVKTDNVVDKLATASTDNIIKKKPTDLHAVTQMTEAMNKFVQAMDANIRFKVHQGTNRLMVQVVDQTNDTVLKEFPSHEFLDTMAAIRDYVGILLDKKI